MNYFRLLEKNIKKFKWYDISLLKLSVFFFTLFLITIWSGLREVVMSFEWYWYLALGIIFAIPLFKKLFNK